MSARRTFYLFLIVAISSTAFAADSQNKRLHSQSNQFDFILGHWAAHGSYLDKTGQRIHYQAKWIGTSLLSGNMISDEFKVTDPSGKAVFWGTTLRIYNPNRKRWEMEWVDILKGSFNRKDFYGEQKGQQMHLRFSDSDEHGDFLMRIVFSDISQNRFLWRADRSNDNGKTWIDNYSLIEAKRISP